LPEEVLPALLKLLPLSGNAPLVCPIHLSPRQQLLRKRKVTSNNSPPRLRKQALVLSITEEAPL
jgi:hypothetical protein